MLTDKKCQNLNICHACKYYFLLGNEMNKWFKVWSLSIVFINMNTISTCVATSQIAPAYMLLVVRKIPDRTEIYYSKYYNSFQQKLMWKCISLYKFNMQTKILNIFVNTTVSTIKYAYIRVGFIHVCKCEIIYTHMYAGRYNCCIPGVPKVSAILNFQ